LRHSVSEVQLRNGARGLFIDVPGATVTTYELNFRAGEFLVPHKKWEVPHLTEHLVWGGANEDNPDRQAFQAEVGRNGAYTNAYTSFYSVAYVGETADFELERVLRLQFKSLEKPLFLQTEFEAEFGNIRDELTSYTNNHFRVLSGEMDVAYGYKTATDKERIKLMDNVVREDLVEHYKRTHFTHNLRFIVAGSLRGRRVAIKRLLEELALPRGASRFRLPEEKAHKPLKPVFIANDTIPNMYLIVSTQHNEIISNKDNDALNLARVLLTDTLYSRIFGQAREHGLVYHVGSGHHISSKSTGWYLNAQVLPENAPALLDIVLAEIKKVQKGIIDDAEFENAKQYALGSHLRSLQTVGNIAGAYSRYFFDGHVEDLKGFPNRVKSLKKRDVANAMCRIFSDKIGDIGVLGGTDRRIAGRLSEQIAPLWHLD
jgi:predicted Zn-dependent peptidase